MWKYVIVMVLNAVLLSSCNAMDGEETKTVKGLYINYEGAEYERAFIPCGSGDVWRIEGFEALEELFSAYESSTTSKFGELFVELKGKFSPVDKMQAPNSHIAGEFHIVEFISSSTDNDVIDKCRS